MKKYCQTCKTEVKTNIISKNETYKVIEDNIEVQAQLLVCSNCHKELYCEELDNITLTTAYNEYRKKHQLLLPAEIKQIRKSYNLNQENFAKLLNWKEETVRKYENGSIQNNDHNELLMFLKKTENMKIYLSKSRTDLNENDLSKLSKLVNNLIDENKNS